ncbi:uncharacterized protein DUF2019 [Roseiarcus fermentans]|uniref:Uncharacterized protein DUF2019 n=1 Tax=Roseiarcus fermentans TaxID=1473586 RepID=A0A366FDV3_9HYPH|nr:DUF2019 domain-containing protein [Roseiarcus fermentans]RBP12852.1 uncharacterized protein DUF2019 [Roseiarcus fermentans]
MSDARYSSLSIEDLLHQFEKSCLIQYDTYIDDDLDVYNREFQTLGNIKSELQSRGPLARRALLRLSENRNKQVRLMAAKHVYPVAKEEATKCLQELAAGPFPDDQVFDARMTLRRLEEVPDCLDH